MDLQKCAGCGVYFRTEGGVYSHCSRCRDSMLSKEMQPAVGADSDTQSGGASLPRALIATQERDAVDHPPHYTNHPSGVECIQIVEHLGFCIGNAIKYLWRADLKGNAVEDLRKARWYVDREIERREKARPVVTSAEASP